MVKALLQYPQLRLELFLRRFHRDIALPASQMPIPGVLINTQEILRYHMPKKLKTFLVKTKSEKGIDRLLPLVQGMKLP